MKGALFVGGLRSPVKGSLFVGGWRDTDAVPAVVVPSGGILNPRHVFDIERDDMEIIKMVVNFLNVIR